MSTRFSKTGIALATGLTFIHTAGAATVSVDWLELPGVGSPAGFSLLDDGGTPVAGGKLSLSQGSSFFNTPAGRVLNDAFWAGETGFADSETGDSSVSAVGFRVAPVAGAASYEIEFSVPAGRSLVLVVGDLFRSALGATEEVLISAFSGAVSEPVLAAGMQSWDNGTSRYDQELVWDETTGRLSTAAGAEGDSSLAFFLIGPLSGENPRIVLTVPNGYAGGITGDPITIGLGLVVVPEPSAVTLAGVAGAFACCLRRRSGGR